MPPVGLTTLCAPSAQTKVDLTSANAEWALSTSNYGIKYISSVGKGNVFGTQFHPEKSGARGLAIFEKFLGLETLNIAETPPTAADVLPTHLAKRVIACLDVRANDAGDLVVTKGDQYDVREKGGDGEGGDVRNLGKPVSTAQKYYEAGADEVSFVPLLTPCSTTSVCRRIFKRTTPSACFKGDIPQHHVVPFVTAQRPTDARGTATDITKCLRPPNGWRWDSRHC